ncbi:hypothetical protein TNCV_4186491 [Trichonephila clavipes]|nr:hypothetical protein TNCV_4186491 [Trichonephila clavipes]
MIEMFSEALRHPLYTLNCTVLPPAFCDWLFNSDVERVIYILIVTVGSLVVRASDSRLEGLGSMPEATKYPPSTHGVRAR